MAGKSTVIAVSGKGGVGKTTLSACIVRHLTERRPGARILAIDADPAIGLSVALGVNADRTLDDIRKTIVHNVEAGQTKEAIEMLGEARFRIFDAITEKDGFAFLAIGRPESAGCYCKVNAYLKEVISLLAEDFDYVVIDGEAGIEQINRRVMEKVTDQSRKGVQVLQTIKKVADEMVMYDRIGAVVNRVSNPEYEKLIEIPGVEILAFIENDGDHASNDIQGRSVFALPEDSRVFAGALAALRKMDIL